MAGVLELMQAAQLKAENERANNPLYGFSDGFSSALKDQNELEQKKNLLEIELEAQYRKNKKMLDLFNAAQGTQDQHSSVNTEFSKGLRMADNPEKYKVSVFNPKNTSMLSLSRAAQSHQPERLTKRISMGSNGNLNISVKSGNENSDLPIVQRMAASKGIIPSGKDRNQLLDEIGGATQSIITINPLTGEPIHESTVSRNSKVYRGSQTPEQKLGLREKQKEQDLIFSAKKDLNTYVSDANQSLVALDKIEKAARDLGDFPVGFIPQAGARIGMATGEFAQDPKIAKYIGSVNQELIPAARKLMEEKGPITESDVSRVEKGLGQKTAPLATKLALINELRDKVRNAIRVKMQVADVSEQDFVDKNSIVAEKAGMTKQEVTKEQAIQELKRRGLIK